MAAMLSASTSGESLVMAMDVTSRTDESTAGPVTLIVLSFLILWGSFLTDATHAAESPDLKGLRLGMSESELTAAMPSLRCSAPKNRTIGDRICSDTKNTIVGSPASILVSLLGDKTYRITIYFSDRTASEVRQALIAKYGEVQMRDARKPVVLSGGREVTRTDDNWGFPMQALQLVHLQGATTNSWVSLTDLSVAKQVYEQRQKDI